MTQLLTKQTTKRSYVHHKYDFDLFICLRPSVKHAQLTVKSTFLKKKFKALFQRDCVCCTEVLYAKSFSTSTVMLLFYIV